MSHRLINRSPDLKRLRDEGYELEVRGGYLILHHVPYVTTNREVRYGSLVAPLTLNNDVTIRPSDHVVSFTGTTPCDNLGEPLSKILLDSTTQTLADGLVAYHRFSSKPAEGYPDFYQKMTAYVAMLSGYAQALDPNATARTFAVVSDDEADSAFQYVDTASSRADIQFVAQKLVQTKVAIVGLGGTGSYVLDLVAKTPVREIHLFDGDDFLQHNAFRAPGAASRELLAQKPKKVAYFRDLYSNMHRGIVAHGYSLDAATAAELRDMAFVFLCATGGVAKRAIITQLEEFGVPFVDVGMGINLSDNSLAGQVRVTTSTPAARAHVWARNRIPCTDGEAPNDYARNIQIAELNALNAALAVIRWKKLLGFYHDTGQEVFSVYQVDSNHLINEDVT